MSEVDPGVGPVVLQGGRPVRTPAGGAPGERLTDFGRQVAGRPALVYRPRSATELTDAIAEATAWGHRVVPRGLGHSVDGQTVVDGSALIDLSGLRRVHRVTDTWIRVDAGATWRDVLDATLPRRRAPVVVPDYLGLTVGGTLSVGGISGASHRFGTAADHVLRATVLDVHGHSHDLIVGDPLLDRVLCGHGRHGVLVAVDLELHAVPRRVRRSDIVTRTLQDHTDVQRNLLTAGSVHWLEGFAVRGVDGLPTFTTRLSRFEELGGPDLAMDRTRGWSDVGEFYARADGTVAGERAVGRWQHHAHPRLQSILPLEAGRGVVEDLLARSHADLLGPGGAVMIYVTVAAALKRLAVRGDQGGYALVVGWQRTAPRDDLDTLRRMQAANRRVVELTRELGGVLYGAVVGRAVAGGGESGADEELKDEG
ncbi:FAD-binding oxidoreductase [Isoptericola halotolerans]|uniref:FAD-binding protein n=1 Tax=Isoptericola halotolerans TaxID=300560 RepID=UPI00389077BA